MALLISFTSVIWRFIISTLRLLLSASRARLAAPRAISSVAAATSLAWVEVAPDALTNCSEVASTWAAELLLCPANSEICSIILLKLWPSRPISSCPLKLVRT
ncbi:hypothetical protein D3C75_933170 [compost metagenome]